MIEAGDIRTLVFDVLGTVVDEEGSVRAEFTAAMVAAGGEARDGDALTEAWTRRFEELLGAVRDGSAPWMTTDELYRAALVDANANANGDAKRGGPRLPDVVVDRLALVGHRLRPWPDAVAALHALSSKYLLVALSNANMSLLADMTRHGGLTWHCTLSGELVRAHKPDPAVYRLAIELLGLDPAHTLMVAAHPWDLRAAATHGLRTAYIRRAGEGQPEPTDRFDLSVDDLSELARVLGASATGGDSGGSASGAGFAESTGAGSAEPESAESGAAPAAS